MAKQWMDRGESLWMDGARVLQLRLRERFRVAVDRRVRLPEVSDYSPTLQRWIHRARSFWEESSSRAATPSYRFYRKRVGKDVEAFDDSIIVRFLQALAVPVLGNACHVFMHGLNHVQIYGAEKLHMALLQRPQGKPLITVSNHVAAVDDPLLIASLLPPSVMLDARNIRWTLCATDRCFKNPVLSTFFSCVKVLPVARGDGIYQKGMDMAISKLNNGGWVHIFPEGSRSRDGGRTMGSPKRGIGRLVMDADNIPLVVPIVHTGMQDIMPIGTHFPKVGKKVTVIIGDPIPLDDLAIGKDEAQHDTRGVLYDAVSSRIGQRLQELKVVVDRLALEQRTEGKDIVPDTEPGYRIWQHSDWEAFGMGSILSREEDTQVVKQEVPIRPTQSLKLESARQTVTASFSREGGIVSRVRGYMDPAEFMGFAARGLIMNSRIVEQSRRSLHEVSSPLRTWRQFVEGNLFC